KKNAHQGYTYASEKAIKEALHNALVKHGVLFTLSTANPRVENGVTWIDCRYVFRDKDSDEQVEGTFIGSGSARDEKGHYAAITGAIKYILTSTFLIPTGDDPEADEAKPVRPRRAGVSTPSPVEPQSPAATAMKKGMAAPIADRLKTIAELAVTRLG